MGTDNMETSFTDSYDKSFLLDTMMGPNAMRVTEELASFLPIEEGMRILDLGCGMGISSILLAQKYKVTVLPPICWFPPQAMTSGSPRSDLRIGSSRFSWTPPSHYHSQPNTSICSSAWAPSTISERTTRCYPTPLPCVKRGGHIGVAVPGLKCDLSDDDKEKLPFDITNVGLYSLSWWQNLWKREGALRLGECREMTDVRSRSLGRLADEPKPFRPASCPQNACLGCQIFQHRPNDRPEDLNRSYPLTLKGSSNSGRGTLSRSLPPTHMRPHAVIHDAFALWVAPRSANAFTMRQAVP